MNEIIEHMLNSEYFMLLANVVACAETNRKKDYISFDDGEYNRLKRRAFSSWITQLYNGYIQRWGVIPRFTYIMLLATKWGQFQFWGRYLKFHDFHWMDYLQNEELQIKSFAQWVYYNYLPNVASQLSPLMVDRVISNLISDIRFNRHRLYIRAFIKSFKGFESGNSYYFYFNELRSCYENIASNP